MLAEQPITIYIDAGAYPISAWGVERAAARSVPVHRFPHRDANALAAVVGRETGRRRPVVVSDGLCTGCGCAAPVKKYLEIVRRWGGQLVMDDTQALGLLGHAPEREAPYGRGGGGSLANQTVSGPDILLVSSLAKAFGAPLAVLSGSRKIVRRFQAGSKTRVHCSPPSLAALHAGERALRLNETQGDKRRNRLAQLVRQFRRQLADNGLSVTGGLFPVQTLRLPYGQVASQLHRALLKRGISAILRHGCDNRLAVSLVITARHRPEEIERVVKAITSALSDGRSAKKKPPSRREGSPYMNKGGL